MPEIDFYNENSGRAFPFKGYGRLDNGELFPAETVVDFHFVGGAESGFNPSEQDVALKEVQYSAPNLTFVFEVLDSSLGDVTCVVPETAESSSIHQLSHAGGAAVAYGFLVVGDLSPLISAMSGASHEISDRWDEYEYMVVEPSRLTTMDGKRVTRVSFYSKEPTQWAPAGEATPASQYELSAEDISVILGVDDGHNVKAYIQDNNLVFEVGIGLGEGLFCNWPAVNGMPLCGELVASINDVPASAQGAFTISGDRGIEVVPKPGEPHTLLVRIGNVGDLFCGVGDVS